MGDEAKSSHQAFENFAPAVQALIKGDVDMVLMDAASSKGIYRRQPGEAQSDRRSPWNRRVRIHSHAPGSDLVEPFNAAIKSMKEDGFLDRLNTYWFFEYNAD
jgi:polar amino acid transport system substrate-binding protein